MFPATYSTAVLSGARLARAPTPTDIPAAAPSPRKEDGGPCGQEAEPRGLEEPRLKRVLDGVPERVPPASLHRVVSHNLNTVPSSSWRWQEQLEQTNNVERPHDESEAEG